MAGWMAACAALGILCIALTVRLWSVRSAARQLSRGIAERAEEPTNTLLSCPSGDAAMRALTDTLNDRLRALRQARWRFESGDLALREAVTNISHDLRTPLTAMCGYLELLEQEELPERARGYVGVISRRADDLRGLTEELFRYTLAASEPEAEKTRVSLNGAIEECLSGSCAVLSGCGIEPVVEMPDAPVYRELDRASLMRVLGNLVSNAVKYSGGDLRVTLTEGGVIEFCNRAPGLDPVQAGRLFERFYTVETGRRSTGLGLSIARLLTERMGGTIAAALRGDELTITLTLPESQ